MESRPLPESERITLSLRALYEQYGYRAFSMNKLEEYAFYVENMNFFGSSQIAAFTDLDGRLMALKPDVTLSIVKSTAAEGVGLEKLYYAETVFRPSARARAYREIRQMGLECIGEVLPYTIAEVVELAAKTLCVVDAEYSLDVSHLGFAAALLEESGAPYAAREGISDCIRQKNPHDLYRLAVAAGVSVQNAERLSRLVTLSGDYNAMLFEARAIASGPAMHAALDELSALRDTLPEARLRLDFSILSDSHYYNGIAFSGYVRKAPAAVLAGGQYDNLLSRMGKGKRRAIGFALYFDELERYYRRAPRSDIDAFIRIDAQSAPDRVKAAVDAFIAQNKTVLADTVLPEGMECGETLDLRGAK